MKKSLYTLLLSLAVGLGFSSCDDKDEPTAMAVPAITIISRDTNFPAAESEGSVKFTATSQVTVSTPNSWITATVVDDEIKISCTQNNSLEGRAGVVTAKCAGGSTDINVIQEGILFLMPDMDALSFTASASSREIEVSANAPVDVTSDADWIIGSCENGVLKVEISQNQGFDARQAQLKIKYGDYEAKLPVSQEGIVLDIFNMTEWLCPDTRKTMTINLPFDVDIEFETPNPDWITSVVNHNTRTWKITAEANTTGHMRTSTFTYTIGAKTATVTVEQCDFTRDLASNSYKLFFTNTSNGQRYYYNARLKKTGANYKIELPDLQNLSIPVAYDADTHKLGVKGGQFCGNFDNLKIYTTFIYYNAEAGGNYYTWAESWTLEGKPSYDESSSQTSILFTDPGTNPNIISYLQLHCFKSTQLSGDTSAGGFVGLMDMELVKQ